MTKLHPHLIDDRCHAMTTLTDLRTLLNRATSSIMSRHSTSSSHGANDPAIGHSMDSDIHELQNSISELLSQYRIARRDDTGRLRQSQQANEFQQKSTLSVQN
ncbi:hypothetical protein BASA50_003820 [Batrachochytrium salamandrivorans]|uniref:Uncharacterized protein n=1 Tax=Batrachochytrium salamandrivorans TaxID=1357716 RepID=A0ABQ8FJX9_9FUNG|nr:hypothetical protein BASA50_003820 [Batrachochytrium salamandrivorans]